MRSKPNSAARRWAKKPVSALIDIRRYGDEWVIEDGSARIRVTKPSAAIIERFVDQWKAGRLPQSSQNPQRRGQAADAALNRPAE